MKLLNVLLCLAVTCTALMSGADSSHMVGGFKTVDHSNDEGVQKAAEFAVEAISNQANAGSKLDLIKIQSAEKQVVAGLNYQLVLEVANDKQKKQTFEAKVYQPLGNQPLQLSTFKELPSGDAHRKAEEGKERSSPALLGAAQEVSPTGD